MPKFNSLGAAAGAILCLMVSAAHARPQQFAPPSIHGLDIVLTIEETESSLPGGYPIMGAVRQTYAADGSYTYSGFGGSNHLTGAGTYVYTKTGPNSATEDAVQYSDFFVLPYRMEYNFVTPTAGLWTQHFAGGLIVFKGSFAISDTQDAKPLAPASLMGGALMLVSEGEQHPLAVTYLTLSESTFAARTLGVRKKDTGNYAFRRAAARSLVLETTGAEGLVVRSFTFTSRYSGYWKATRALDGSRSQGRFLLLH